jgi:hypothetical protein
MAVSTGTLLAVAGNNNTTSTNDSTAFSPAANSLVIVQFGNADVVGTSGGPITISDTFAGGLGAWATIASVQATGSGTSPWRSTVWRAQATGSPGTGTVRFVATANNNRHEWIIVETQGHDTSTPISEFATNTSTANTLDVALGGIAAGNLAMGFLTSRDGTGATPGANEREITEITAGAGIVFRAQAEDGTDNTVNWTTIGTMVNIGIAFEIAASGGAPTGTFQLERIERHYPRGAGRGVLRGVL